MDEYHILSPAKVVSVTVTKVLKRREMTRLGIWFLVLSRVIFSGV
jgi:hypothetical protein